MNTVSKLKPHVYLAGKIYPYDWRHKIAPGLRSAGAIGGHYPPHYKCKSFVYTGPFFECDDHSGTHGPACHGNCEGQLWRPPISKPALFLRNNYAIEEADFLLAYINAYDCIGTICEVTYAWCLGKPIFLVFSPKIEQDEFWYPSQMVKATYTATEAELPALFKTILAAWRVLK